MFVWIPRFAYKVNSSDKTFDVVFLIGTTDYYYKDGGLQKAQRATADNTAPTTTGDVYTVHPAFTNESSINYANGGWDSELTGIWVAKFEAGYAGGNNTATVKKSGVGSYNYPVFRAQTYSINYISINNAYSLSKALTTSTETNKNIYGLKSTSTDSHLMKNSEWGAVAYLAQSQYGLNGTDIALNNVSLEKSTDGSYKNLFGVTGYSTTNSDKYAGTVTVTVEDIKSGADIDGVAKWNESAGTGASSTGTIYGIYDLSGGEWEYTASYIANGNSNLSNGDKLTAAFSSTDTKKYVMLYASNDSGITDYDTASRANYTEYIKAENVKIGDAIVETAGATATGTGASSWGSNLSHFPGYGDTFFTRGGRWNITSNAGLFAFNRVYGGGYWDIGFRAVLVEK
jgi:hypothetical protein